MCQRDSSVSVCCVTIYCCSCVSNVFFSIVALLTLVITALLILVNKVSIWIKQGLIYFLSITTPLLIYQLPQHTTTKFGGKQVGRSHWRSWDVVVQLHDAPRHRAARGCPATPVLMLLLVTIIHYGCFSDQAIWEEWCWLQALLTKTAGHRKSKMNVLSRVENPEKGNLLPPSSKYIRAASM